MKYYLALHNCISPGWDVGCFDFITLIDETGKQLKADSIKCIENNFKLSDEFRFILKFINHNIIFEITENEKLQLQNILKDSYYCSSTKFTIKENMLYIHEPENVVSICEISNSKMEFFKK